MSIRLFDLTGKNALVTGGTHGIVMALATALADAGATIIVNDMFPEKLEEAKVVAKGMIARGRGKIINMCSMMSELGRSTVSAYAASKGGLKMLTRNMATEWARHNIQINGIGPGYIATSQTGE